jgi:hypothetical protein
MAATVRVSKALPQAIADTGDGATRGGRYGELYVTGIPRNKYILADEGTYFVATSAINTAILATGSTTAYSATASAFIFLNNTESLSAAAPKRIYLDYLKLQVKVIPGSAVDLQFVAEIDNGTATYTSGGSLITPVNVNGDSTNTSVVGATMYAGALVTAARTNGRSIGRGTLKPFIPKIYDQFVISFGTTEMGGDGVMAAGTSGGTYYTGCPPIIVAPGWNFTLSLYGASTAATGAQYEFEMGWWER